MALLTYFLGKNDKQTSENGSQVEKQVERVLDTVSAASSSFLHDSLGIVEDKSGHGKQPNVQMCL